MHQWRRWLNAEYCRRTIDRRAGAQWLTAICTGRHLLRGMDNMFYVSLRRGCPLQRVDGEYASSVRVCCAHHQCSKMDGFCTAVVCLQRETLACSSLQNPHKLLTKQAPAAPHLRKTRQHRCPLQSARGGPMRDLHGFAAPSSSMARALQPLQHAPLTGRTSRRG